MNEPPVRWLRLGTSTEVAARAPMTVVAGDREIAVFRLDGGFAAVENSCPHAGGPLAEGTVEDGIVECPWHCWRFDLRTGACRHSPMHRLRTYSLREVAGVVEVAVPDA
jgi:nitrite reductase/ring-hydroxylating ferredoxin subunit